MKSRWNFGGQPGSHGTERKHRSPGGIGGGHGAPVRSRPQIIAVKKMAGHRGDESVTPRNHLLVSVDNEKNLLWIQGPLPLANGGLLFIRQSKTIINNTK